MPPKEAGLPQQQLKALLHYAPLTGLFTWKQSRGSRKAGATAGRLRKDGYVEICIDRKYHQAARLAWLYCRGAWPAGEVDHRNWNRSDNRIRNLRDVSTTVNQQNIRKAHVDSLSGYLGVHWSKWEGKWQSRISVNGKRVHLGYFKTAEAGHKAYLKAKRQFHPGNRL